MADQVVTRPGMPESGMRHRRSVIPRTPLNDEASGLRSHLEVLSDLFGRLVRGYLMLGVRPGNMSEQPAAGSLGLEGPAVDGGHLIGIDETFLELKRLVVAKVQTAYPQNRRARRYPQKLTAFRIVLELTTLQQSILVSATTAGDDVRDVPDFENWAFQSALGDYRADAPPPLNQAVASETLYCAADGHTRCAEAPRQRSLGRNPRARWPDPRHDGISERAAYLLPDGTLAIEGRHSQAVGRPPSRSSGPRGFSVHRRIGQVSSWVETPWVRVDLRRGRISGERRAPSTLHSLTWMNKTFDNRLTISYAVGCCGADIYHCCRLGTEFLDW